MSSLPRRSRIGVVCIYLFLSCVMASQFAHAQSTTQGAIAGTVQDASGAVISDAAVTIHNAGTNAEITLTSDASGYFKAPLVEPGTYTVTIVANGFGNYTAN